MSYREDYKRETGLVVPDMDDSELESYDYALHQYYARLANWLESKLTAAQEELEALRLSQRLRDAAHQRLMRLEPDHPDQPEPQEEDDE